MKVACARRVSKVLAPRPSAANSRSKAAGLRYEHNLNKALANSPHCLAVHNPAFQYEFAETNRAAFCIPDFVLSGLDFLHPGAVVILESKLTYKPGAAEKLIDLYAPVVQRALCAREVWPVVVAKNLTRDCPEPHFTLKTALMGRIRGDISGCPTQPPNSAHSVPVVQWLGKGEFPISN